MKIAIIGAGLSGLTLASKLSQRHQVTVFEKARGPGGRMSTRRADPHAFDHGAQYFTAREPRFQRFIGTQISAGLIAPWPVDIALHGGARVSDSPKYVATPGMNAVCKALASEMDVQAQAHVEALIQSAAGWQLQFKDGAEHGPFDWVVSTAPAEQTQALLPESFSGQEALQSVQMQGCFALMLGFSEPLDVPFAALKSGEPPIGWMAVNSAKPGRAAATSLLIQSDNAWAEAHLEDDPSAVTQILLAAGSDLASIDLSIAPHQVLHRWRYAATSHPAGQPFLIDPTQRLAACGDWCLGSKVEAAFCSAIALADHFESLTKA
ncbi:MAG: NAD(P)-binding protein [Pseudomonadota bacterium]